MKAIEALLAGLFDYAGLYPPASLELSSAAKNYLEYARAKRAALLGRFIINIDRLDELRAVAGDALGQFRISAIVTDSSKIDALCQQVHLGMPIESVEIRCARPEEIERTAQSIPKQFTAYFEVPVNAAGRAALESIAGAGARAKIRMGGVVPEAFPSVFDVAEMLSALANLRLPFKATAGLHHPIRSCRKLTYESEGPMGTMHGFMNLCCAAAVVYLGGRVEDAREVLEEEEAAAWEVEAGALRWRDLRWTADQLARLRLDFFEGIGSCSFEEPMNDLESLGWL